MFDFTMQPSDHAVAVLVSDEVEYYSSFYNESTMSGLQITRMAGVVTVDGEDVRYTTNMQKIYDGDITIYARDGEPE